jgi:hypothetical protein
VEVSFDHIDKFGPYSSRRAFGRSNQFGVLGQITTVIKSHHTWGLRTITRKFLGMVRTKEMSRKCLRKLGKGVYTSRFEDVLFEDRFLE